MLYVEKPRILSLRRKKTSPDVEFGRRPNSVEQATAATPFSRIRWLILCLPIIFWSTAVTAWPSDNEKPAAAAQPEAKKAEPSSPPARLESGAASPAVPRKESFLSYCWTASPFFFVLMSMISIYLGALVVNAFLKLRTRLIMPPALMARIDSLLQEKKFREAFEAARDDPSLLGRSVSIGAERLSIGFDKASDAALTVVDDGKLTLEHHISPIATIGALGPLLGLLGTVLGMIQAFQEIATGGQPRPGELARSIGLALVSTLEGLIVAIPAIFFFGLFRNKIARIIFDVETLVQDYLVRFNVAVKK